MASYSMVQPPARVFEDVPVLCGHRGCGRGVVEGLRENTLESFLAAVAAGLGWVEVDVRATADGDLVASHDPIGPDGRPIAGLSSGEAERLELMRIADLLRELPPHAGVNLEIKTAIEDAARPREETTAALTARLLRRERGDRRVLVTSFDASAPLLVRERLPEVSVGLLTWMGFPLAQAIPAAVHLGMEVLAPHVQSFQLAIAPPDELARTVRAAHDAGLELVGWCPGRDDSELLMAAGVDCLIVDDVPAFVAG